MAYKGKKGLHDDWVTGQGLENVCKWAKLGLSDEQLAKNMGICRTTYYKWLKDFPDFAKAIKEARRIPNLEIENSMFELACDRVYVEEIKTSLDPKTGETSMGYREQGYLPEAIINFLALLGWNPGTEQEIFSMEELIQAFSFNRVSKSGAKFDIEKAKWFNHKY